MSNIGKIPAKIVKIIVATAIKICCLFVVCKQEPEFGLALVISKAGQAGKRILEAE